jgi:hypothetical protein
MIDTRRRGESRQKKVARLKLNEAQVLRAPGNAKNF